MIEQNHQQSPESKRQRHRFAPGNKLGTGRPVGSRNKATIALQTLLENEGEKITRKAIEMALAGDTTAMRLVIERLIPTRKERTINVRLPELRSIADVPTAIGTVLRSIAQGELTPSEGESLVRIVDMQRHAIETQELECRIAALEGRK